MHPTDDDPAPPTAWELAVAEHEATLVKGTRVRIMPGEGCHHHGEQEAGVTGVILAVGLSRFPPSENHPYCVLFDRPLWITKSQMTTWYYAAAELTPVPWPTPEEVVRDTLARVAALSDT